MSERVDTCQHEHRTPESRHSDLAVYRAAGMLRAAGEPSRLRVLELLTGGELCVSEVAQLTGESLPAVSQRLKVLRQEGLATSRREGKHVLYSLADQHVIDLILTVLEHAQEPGHAKAGTFSPGDQEI
jgi:ArsR family transcriptional regulator, lead/cadmium/zinc/bismuth-responsive transcriptional repressor